MNAATITALGIAGISALTALTALLLALAANETAKHAQARLDAREANASCHQIPRTAQSAE